MNPLPSSQRQGNIAIVIGAQRRAAALALEQREGCEHRQLEALMKDERRFEAAIGEEKSAVELRQAAAIFGVLNIGHDPISG